MMAEQKKNKRKPRLNRYRDFRRWFGFEAHRDLLSRTFMSLRRLFIPDQQEIVESFDAAAKRLQLTDENLQSRQRTFFAIALFMIVVMVTALLATIYLGITGHFRPGLIALAVTFVSAGLAFRYHFWSYQLKQRKLGCTVSEWFAHSILRKSK